MKKTIVIICNYKLIPERVGGMDHFFWMFDKLCKNRGFNVDWVFPNYSNHDDYTELNILSSDSNNLETFIIQHIKKNSQHYSHIITHFLELCTPFFKQLKHLTIAKIITVDHNPRPLGGYPYFKKIKKRIKGILYSRYIDSFVAVSNYTKNEIVRDFGKQVENKTCVIYNGVLIDDINVREFRSVKQPTFLVASHLRESKGIQDLIKSVAILPKNILELLKIDIYGDGPYEKELKQLVNNLDLKTNINFMGSVPNLNNIYCNYDYLLQPTHMECFSLSILESLAANVPVITTPVGGNEEVIVNNKNGFIFKAKETHELSGLLKGLWMGKIGIEESTRDLILQNFTIKKMVQEHFELTQ